MRKPALATRVSPYVNQSVRKLAKALGITISEYLRKLILQDLDSRKMFQDELKKAVEKSEEGEHVGRKSLDPAEILARTLREEARKEDEEFPRKASLFKASNRVEK
jgi:hypothetical protein